MKVARRVKQSASLAEELLDHGRGLVRRASAAVAGAIDGPTPAAVDGGVHEARKAFKKLRALLRLLRAGLDEERYTEENRLLRNLGRRLAAQREEAVLVASLHRLCAEAPDEAVTAAVAALTPSLQVGRAPKSGGARLRAMRGVLTGLVAAETRWAAMTLPRHDGDGARIVAAGLKRTFRRGRRAMRRAMQDPSAVRVHEWRKQVKHLQYMAGFLGRSWPRLEAGRRLALAELAAVAAGLGEDHDLWMLRAHLLALTPRLSADGEVDAAPAAVAVLVAKIDERRIRLQLVAMDSGRLLFKSRPKGLKKALRTKWRARGRP